MVGLIFQNWFFSILTAKDRAKGIQRGALGTGFVCLSQKKNRMNKSQAPLFEEFNMKYL